MGLNLEKLVDRMKRRLLVTATGTLDTEGLHYRGTVDEISFRTQGIWIGIRNPKTGVMIIMPMETTIFQ
jgi:hypothetical protein